MKIFIVECPNPIDILQERTEYQSLEKVCKIIGHEAASFLVKSEFDLRTVIKYIATLDATHDLGNNKGSYVCLHLSAHGNEDGLAIGSDFLEWGEILRILTPILAMEDYPQKVILSISACGANQQKLTSEFKSEWKKIKINDGTPPKYLFVFDNEEIYWSDAVLGWSILFHQLEKVNLDIKEDVQNILKRMKNSYLGNLKYYRWDDEEQGFKRFIPRERKK